MLKKLSIQNFRGFQDFEIGGFDRINIITGKNNIGKTALLEAIFLNCGSHNPQLALAINAFRGFESIAIEFTEAAEMPWNSIFYNYDIKNNIQINSEDNQNHYQLDISVNLPKNLWTVTSTKKKIKGGSPSIIKSDESDIYPELDFHETVNGISSHNLIKFTPSGLKVKFTSQQHFPSYFISSRKVMPSAEDAELFGKIDLSGNIENITNTLKQIEPRLKRLSIIIINKEPVIHADIGSGHLIPLPLLGEGINRLAGFLLRILLSKNGVVIIDEIENGFHYSFLEDLWRIIYDAANENNVQIFSSTHSFECIKAAHVVNNTYSNYHLKLFRLDRIEKDRVIAKSYPKDILNSALSTNFEVR